MVSKKAAQVTLCVKKRELDGCALTIEDIVGVAQEPRGVQYTLSKRAIQQIEASNALKHKLMEAEQPIYGVTTGLCADSCRES